VKRIIHYLEEYNQYHKENADRHRSTVVEHHRLTQCVCHHHQHQPQHQEHHPMDQELCIHNNRRYTLRNQELGEDKVHQAQTKGSGREHTFLSGHHNRP